MSANTKFDQYACCDHCPPSHDGRCGNHFHEEDCELCPPPYKECEGHPAGEHDPMGETVYCDGSCQR